MDIGSPEPRGYIHWRWRKSSRTANTGQCVEIGNPINGEVFGIRDTKDRDGGTLFVDRATFAAFLADAKASRFS